jgi:DNA polymerase-1
MSRYVFDIETDGLYAECSRMWVLVSMDMDTGECRHWREGDLSWMAVFNEAEWVVGHNIIGYDLMVLNKLFGYTLPRTCKVFDTLLLSQILDYKRFGHRGHSLELWGESLGFPKIEFEDWTKFSPEMLTYCIQDVKLTMRVFTEVQQELLTLAAKKPEIRHYVKAEHAVARWSAAAESHGWPFDAERAGVLQTRLEASMQLAYTALSARLGTKTVPVDKVKGEVEVKRPKWTKVGFYDAHTARWFNVDPCSGYPGEERMIEGEYCRVTFEPLSLDSVADVKIFLYRNAWVPTEWNTKLEDGKKVKTSPKITEDSLEFLGGDGKLYTDFLTSKSRLGILKTWMENVDENGMLHGGCMTIGTPSMRSRHSIIVNVPSGEQDKDGKPVSPWGKEMRQLFSTMPGYKLVGCDSSGNQARGLAHYLKDPEFIQTLLHGDIHQYNADILTKVLNRIGVKYKRSDLVSAIVTRSQAKRILYAFLFGASGGKLWSYVFGVVDDDMGKELKKGFLSAVPGFQGLLDNLKRIYSSTKKFSDGYIPSIAGNRVYVDSMHKLLVYLLQACEKATCSAAVMLIMERLDEAGIPYVPLIMMHDEANFMVPEEHAEQAAAIGKQAFVDGPKLFGIEIMDGDAKIGNNWYEIH